MCAPLHAPHPLFAPQDPHATAYDTKEWTFVVENVSAPPHVTPCDPV